MRKACFLVVVVLSFSLPGCVPQHYIYVKDGWSIIFIARRSEDDALAEAIAATVTFPQQ